MRTETPTPICAEEGEERDAVTRSSRNADAIKLNQRGDLIIVFLFWRRVHTKQGASYRQDFFRAAWATGLRNQLTRPSQRRGREGLAREQKPLFGIRTQVGVICGAYGWPEIVYRCRLRSTDAGGVYTKMQSSPYCHVYLCSLAMFGNRDLLLRRPRGFKSPWQGRNRAV